MNAKYSLTVKGQNFGPIEQKGYLCSILVREGDTWKMRMFTWNITPVQSKRPQRRRRAANSFRNALGVLYA